MSEKDYQWAVLIGRFQPIHNSHVALIRGGLEIANRVIVMLGSSESSLSARNPWTSQQRQLMIEMCFSQQELDRIDFVPLRDYFYNENAWLMEVQTHVNRITGGTADEQICLLGSLKDHTSRYLKQFPQWELESIPTKTLHATDVRNQLFQKVPVPNWEEDLHPRVRNYITQWMNSPEAQYIREEHQFIKEYQEQWANTPHPPVFVTTDTIVVKSGHVLVVNRKFCPGKGLRALPGGFLKPQELIVDGALRELKEETRIQVDKQVLKRNIVTTEVFDYPQRDPRGRTITHGFLIDLGEGPLPEVRGGDDAKHCEWIPYREVFENVSLFYSDHAHIILHFLMEKRQF